VPPAVTISGVELATTCAMRSIDPSRVARVNTGNDAGPGGHVGGTAFDAIREGVYIRKGGRLGQG